MMLPSSARPSSSAVIFALALVPVVVKIRSCVPVQSEPGFPLLKGMAHVTPRAGAGAAVAPVAAGELAAARASAPSSIDREGAAQEAGALAALPVDADASAHAWGAAAENVTNATAMAPAMLVEVNHRVGVWSWGTPDITDSF